jgi:DNA-binding IclR family transcriptional regulator
MKTTPSHRLILSTLAAAARPLTFAELLTATELAPNTAIRYVPQMVKANQIVELTDYHPVRYVLPISASSDSSASPTPSIA